MMSERFSYNCAHVVRHTSEAEALTNSLGQCATSIDPTTSVLVVPKSSLLDISDTSAHTTLTLVCAP